MKKNIKPRFDSYLVICVGLGGTGGMFSTMFSRYVYSMKTDDSKKFKFVLIDGDYVEEKNIARQPFTEDDINLSKVEALEESFSDLFSIPISAYPLYIDNVEQLEQIIKDEQSNMTMKSNMFYTNYRHTIIVGAVDNHRCRQELHKFFCDFDALPYADQPEDSNELIYIDSANEFSNGEIVYGIKRNKKIISPDRAWYFPNILTDTGKKASETSCGEINFSSPQHFATNTLAANLCFSAIAGHVHENILLDGITYFDSFSSYVNHVPFSKYVEAIKSHSNTDLEELDFEVK